MEYFFIAGNVASLAALVGFLLQLTGKLPNADLVHITIALAVALTTVFWLFFYFAPGNRIKKAVRDRLDFAGSYLDSASSPVEVYEGTFDLSNFDYLAVPLPPFETTPTITLFATSPKQSPKPSISAVTLDSFEVHAMSSGAWGAWRFRARGRQLIPRDATP